MEEIKEKNWQAQNKCRCPFCDAEVDEAFAHMCQACQVEIRYCSNCALPVPKDAEVCPECKKQV
ncbi:MAG: hypothetical protein AB1652_11225 [Bacillota bacterium]